MGGGGPPPPPPPMAPMGVPSAALDAGRMGLMNSLRGTGIKRMLKPVPRKEKKHFNMIELLKVEEKKKKGGIGVSTKAKSAEVANPAPAAAASKKPTAQDLLAVKLRRKEAEPKASQPRTEQLKSD